MWGKQEKRHLTATAHSVHTDAPQEHLTATAHSIHTGAPEECHRSFYGRALRQGRGYSYTSATQDGSH